jgi:hypothetical protein
MKAITVDQLGQMCAKMSAQGNGKKMILISSDDECNEYHELWSGFTDTKQAQEYIDSYQLPRGVDLKDYVILT